MNGFWSTQTLRARIQDQEVVRPYNPDNVDIASYHLSMGCEGFVSSDRPRRQVLVQLSHVTIPPGQFAQLLTHEEVSIPKDAIGFISLRTGRKMGGLINVSGFHVDPGYEGKLVFSVFNAGTRPVLITALEPVFSLWLASLDEPVENGYSGSRSGLQSLRDEDMAHFTKAVPSAATLEERLAAAEHTARRAAWAAGLAVTVAISFAAATGLG